jgi:hypothetical protein
LVAHFRRSFVYQENRAVNCGKLSQPATMRLNVPGCDLAQDCASSALGMSNPRLVGGDRRPYFSKKSPAPIEESLVWHSHYCENRKVRLVDSAVWVIRTQYVSQLCVGRKISRRRVEKYIRQQPWTVAGATALGGTSRTGFFDVE